MFTLKINQSKYILEHKANYLLDNVATVKQPTNMTKPKPVGGRVWIFVRFNVLMMGPMYAHPKYGVSLLLKHKTSYTMVL